ncbi:MAG: HD domain-containing protein [Chloroflexi bacterium]|nr:HD domain-containing protein [Chloroflexota bacterium]
MRVATRALYRSRQFFGAVRPRIDAELLTEAFRLLSEPERRLFETMTTRDQQHCLAVYARLRGQANDDLLTAALLHDAGKGRIALWHRVAYVLLEAASPALLRRLAKPGDGPGWRQALDRCRRHSELGAQLAEEAGSSGIAVALIREDSGHAPTELVAALKAADEEA